MYQRIRNYAFSHNFGLQGPVEKVDPSAFMGPLQPGKVHSPFSARDLSRLGDSDPRFLASLAEVFRILQEQGWDPGVVSGIRAPAEQAEKVRLKFSKAMNRQHLFGRAADIVHRPTGYSLGLADPFFKALGPAAEAESLI